MKNLLPMFISSWLLLGFVTIAHAESASSAEGHNMIQDMPMSMWPFGAVM